MWRKHLIGICFSVLVFLGCTTLFPYRPLTSDKNLMADFYAHQADFERLAAMASDDTGVTSVSKFSVSLKDYKTWQNDDQTDFSNERWNEYKKLFKQLGNRKIYDISKHGDIIKIADASSATSRIDDYRSIIISKGYAYSLNEPSNSAESLDEMGFESRGIFYKKIGEHWYLYHETFVTEPN